MVFGTERLFEPPRAIPANLRESLREIHFISPPYVDQALAHSSSSGDFGSFAGQFAKLSYKFRKLDILDLRRHDLNLQLLMVTTLYRPVGPKELELTRQSGFREFPRRLPSQPIFYPVLNEEYATQIARDWNAKNSDQRAGFVTKFHVRTEYLAKFEVKPSAVRSTKKLDSR